MKRFKVLLGILPVLGMTMFSFAACTTERLMPPSGFYLDADYVLSWYGIPEARSYTVEITAADAGEENAEAETRSTRRESISLADLPEGTYDVRVRSVGGRGNNVFSDWAEAVTFDRERESGILYELTAGGAEYTVAGAGSVTGDIDLANEEFEYVHGRPVTSVKAGAFRGNTSVETVKIGGRITRIGDRAFYNCSALRSVELSDDVSSIGSSAFQSCTALTAIKLPAELRSVGLLTFGYCTALQEVTFNEGLTEIGESAFYGCGEIGELLFPDSLETIGKDAFSAGSSLKNVFFGSGKEGAKIALREIGQNAFRASSGSLLQIDFGELAGELTFGDYCFAETQLHSVNIPEGTVKIGTGAFYNAASLSVVDIPASVTEVCQHAFTGTELYLTESEFQPDGLIYADDWLVGVTNETYLQIGYLGTPRSVNDQNDLVVPFRDGTVGIAEMAFERFDAEVNSYVGAPKLFSVIVPETLKYIGNYAFYGSPELYSLLDYGYDTALSEPSGLAVIGDGAFSGCEQLDMVILTDGLESINYHAFFGCIRMGNSENLTPSTLTHIGQNAFFGTRFYNDAINTVVYAGNWLVGYDLNLLMDQNAAMNFDGQMPDNIIGVADYALGGCIKLEKIDLTHVHYIGKSAFTLCTGLSSVTFGNDLEEIPAFAFYGSVKLRSVEFTRYLSSIGRYAFFLSGIIDLDLSATRVTSIGEFAFYGCTDMRSLLLPTRYLQEIGGYAFYKCMSLAEVDFMGVGTDSPLVSIGERAFADCAALGNVVFGNNLEEIGPHAFRACTSLSSVILPASMKTIGNNAFASCSGLLELNLGGTQEIGRFAFAHADRLTSLTIPASVVSIGEGAFFGDGALATVTMLGTPASVGANVFLAGDLTVYLAAESAPKEWSLSWNSGFRPAVWGCTFAEEGYVDSVTVGADTLTDRFAYMGISAPARKGYLFEGWATVRGGKAEYTAKELGDVPAGTVLYAVWTPRGTN